MSLVKFLIDHGADKNAGEWTPLHAVAEKNNVASARVLVENGANINAKAWGQTPYDVAMSKGKIFWIF